MKKVFKILGYVILFLVVVLGGLITYVKVALPNVGEAPKLTVERTAERIARGKYLANNVTLCVSCHSARDWSRFSGPINPDSLGCGGEVFDQKVGLPGAYYSKNITPTAISRYTDGELFRVITTGVTKDGKALFPLMPYSHYGKMDPEDINCIIAYVRSLAPLQTTVPESVSDFPMNIIINTIPAKAVPGKLPDTAALLEYGAYMVNATGCIECHTRENHGQIIPSLAFSGGREFRFPDGSVLRSPNITTDKTTGIGMWTKDMFISKFKSYAMPGYVPPAVAKGAYNTVMPWTQYAGMTTQDLGAIYTYLASLPAQQNVVNKFTPAPAVAKQ